MAFDWGSFWQGTGAGVVQAGTTIGTEIAEAPMKRLEMKRKGLDIKKMEEDEKEAERKRKAERKVSSLQKPGARIEEIKSRKVAMETAPGEISVTEDVGPTMGREATDEDVSAAAYDVDTETGLKYDLYGVKKSDIARKAAEDKARGERFEAGMGFKEKELGWKQAKARVDQAIDYYEAQIKKTRAAIYGKGMDKANAVRQIQTMTAVLQAAPIAEILQKMRMKGMNPEEIGFAKEKWDRMNDDLLSLAELASGQAVEKFGAGTLPSGEESGEFSRTAESEPPDIDLQEIGAELDKLNIPGGGGAAAPAGGPSPKRVTPQEPPFEASTVKPGKTVTGPDGSKWKAVNGKWQRSL